MGSALAWILPLAVLAGLAIYRLDAKSLWFDEIFSVRTASSGFRGIVGAAAGSEANMVLYYAVLHVWLALGSGETWVRLLSVAFAVATVPVVFALGRLVGGSRAGAIAAALFAVNAFVVEYAQEARSYTLTMLLVSLALWSTVRFLREGRRTDGVFLVVTATAALYAHVFAAFVVLALGLAIGLARSDRLPRRRAVMVAIGIGLLGLPLAAAVVKGHDAQLAWVGATSPAAVARTLATLAGGGDIPGQEDAWAWCLAFVVFGLAALGGLKATTTPQDRSSRLVLGLTVVVPFVAAIAISLVKPIVVPRYFAVVLPAVVVLAAMGILRLPRPPRIAVVALAAALALHGVASWYVGHPKTDWRGAVAFLSAHAGPSDVLVVYEDWNHTAIDYYWRAPEGRKAPTRIWRGLGATDATSYAAALDQGLRQTPSARVWLVLASGSRGVPTPGDPRFQPLREGYRVGSMTRFDELTLVRFDATGGGSG